MVKNLSAMWETRILIPGSGRFPGKGNGNLLQYSCLWKSTDRGASYSPRGQKRLETTEQLKRKQNKFMYVPIVLIKSLNHHEKCWLVNERKTKVKVTWPRTELQLLTLCG